MAATNYDLTPKQEAFACAYVETGNASEAYRRAYQPKKMGQKAITVESTRLMQHPSIALAIEKLQATHAERHKITVGSITQMLKEGREKAHAAVQMGAAVSASMGLAKLHGLVKDKVRVEHEDNDLRRLTDAELAAKIRALEALRDLAPDDSVGEKKPH
jgi:phage terminase small subunit